MAEEDIFLRDVVENQDSGDEAKSSLESAKTMTENLISKLMVSTQAFDCCETLCEIQNIFSSTNSRILYNIISLRVFENIKDDKQNHEIILINIQSLLSYIDKELAKEDYEQSQKEEIFKAQKAMLKVYDHINLANMQYNRLKPSSEELNKEFREQISSVRGDITGDLMGSLIGMVSIFTALAFLFFFMMSSMDVIINAIKETSVYKILAIICIWGAIAIDLFLVFVVFITWITNHRRKSGDSPRNLGELQPIFYWSNRILLSLVPTFLWLYYLEKNQIRLWGKNFEGFFPYVLFFFLVVLWIQLALDFHKKMKP